MNTIISFKLYKLESIFQTYFELCIFKNIPPPSDTITNHQIPPQIHNKGNIGIQTIMGCGKEWPKVI